MYTNNNEPIEILSDDEDENEARLTCSLRWLINKAYPDGTQPDYLPSEHFFQQEGEERFLSPDIALVLLSGDLYIRAFQTITHQQDQFLTYEDLQTYFSSNKIDVDFDALKQDDPLNAQVHLELIDQLMKIYGKTTVDQNLIYQRFDKLRIKSVSALKSSSTRLDMESLFIIWLNGIAEYMADQWTQRIPPVIDLRSALIDGTCLCALVSFYDEEYRSKKTRNDLKFLRHYLNHLNEKKMTNFFPFTIKHLKENLIPDLNLQMLLVDLFFIYEIERNHSEMNFEDEENQLLNRSNQTYSLNGDDDDVDIEEFFINNNQSNSFEIGAVLQSTDNQPLKSNLKTSFSTSTISKKSLNVPSPTTTTTTTTWQRQAASHQMKTTPSDRTSFDDSQYLSVKMQLEMKKRSIEREKQRLEKMRDNKRQTISQEAFKQLLQQKTRTSALLNNEFSSSNESNSSMKKSRTTNEFQSTSKKTSSIVDLSKPMTRDEFIKTLEILKQKYIESNPTTTTTTNIQEQQQDEDRRIEQLNNNIGELQQVLTSLSVKQEEIHNQVVHANNTVVSRHATFSTKSMTIPRCLSNAEMIEEETEPKTIVEQKPSTKTNGFVLDFVEDPSASTAIEMERKRELVLQRQQQRQEAYERRRQTRENKMNKRDDERRRRDQEESLKKVEREQRRDEIFRQYLLKKEKQNQLNYDHNHENEHPIIKMRPKTSTTTIANAKPAIERRQTAPITISPFGTPNDNENANEFLVESDLNETITKPSLSFVRMAELRSEKSPSTTNRIDSRTLPRPSARQHPTEPTVPLIPISEPRYPLAKPLSGKSNKQTIINALSQVILAGRVNDRQREQVCDEIERHCEKVKHFILLFRDSRLQFRSVYAFIPSNDPDVPAHLERLFGQGPREIANSMVDTFYKYNNGSKKFSSVPIKSFSVQCDAITISNQYWSQSTTKRATQPSSMTPSDSNLS